jgi:hypothetical protein
MPDSPSAEDYFELENGRFILFAVDIDSQTDSQTLYAWSSSSSKVSITIYSASDSVEMYNLPNGATPVTGKAGRNYILAYSDTPASIALQSYAGTAIPLTLVKVGDQLNLGTGRIASADTGLQKFTILGRSVEHEDAITVRNVTNLNPSVVTNDPDATVEIFGGVDLAEGEHSVIVTITAADGTTTETYVIMVTVLLNTISEETVAAVQGLSAATPADVPAVVSSVIVDLFNNMENAQTVMAHFLEALYHLKELKSSATSTKTRS